GAASSSGERAQSYAVGGFGSGAGGMAGATVAGIRASLPFWSAKAYAPARASGDTIIGAANPAAAPTAGGVAAAQASGRPAGTPATAPASPPMYHGGFGGRSVTPGRGGYGGAPGFNPAAPAGEPPALTLHSLKPPARY
ncbi:hypothetical protein MNEG_16380, partial [Monoraphidium neglectum]